ncbi:hypothetical protein [Lentzea sp. NBRC 105346]|nr:hypothetical protein [Lentzea sp. NBRC 105346]
MRWMILVLVLTACGVEPQDEPVPVSHSVAPTLPKISERPCPLPTLP